MFIGDILGFPLKACGNDKNVSDSSDIVSTFFEKSEKKMISLFKRCGYLITIIFSIVTFYIINYLFLAEYFNAYITKIYTNNFNFIINSLSGHTNILEFLAYLAPDYPPLYFLNLLLPVYFFGRNWTLLLLTVNTFYLLILLTFTYLVGKEIRDEKTGLIATVLIALYPFTWITYRICTLEFPVMAIIVMSVYILYRSGYFTDLKWSIFFALSCAWGLWIKDIFAAFIIGPILYGFYRAIITYRKDKNIQPLLNFMVFSTTFILLICPCYFYNFKMNGATYHSPFLEATPFHWYDIENIRPFLFSFWEQLLSLPFLIVFAASIYYFIKYCEKNIKAAILLWILIPTVILILMPHWKTVRYLVPLLPALSLISALFLRKIIDKKAGMVVLLILIFIGVAQYYMFTYGRSELNVDYIMSNIADYKKVNEEKKIVRSNLLEAAKKIKIYDKMKDRLTVTIFEDFQLSWDINTIFWFDNIHDFDVNPIYFNGPVKYFQLLYMSDILLKAEGMGDYEGIKKYYLDENKTCDWEQYESIYNKVISKFKLVKTFSIPSGKIFYLYTRYE